MFGLGNSTGGVGVAADSNVIGGAAPGAGNVISANGVGGPATGVGLFYRPDPGGPIPASHNIIKGNLIGTDRTGLHALGNTGLGISVGSASFTQVGGPTTAERNVISGNGDSGIFIGAGAFLPRSTNTLIQGNLIGTDITGQGPFNASFSLTGDMDSDGDGVPDSQDQCADTPAGGIINSSGCTIDQLVPCEGPSSGGTWQNHGQYVSAVAHISNTFKKEGLISGREKGQIVSTAAQSECGNSENPGDSGDSGNTGNPNKPKKPKKNHP